MKTVIKTILFFYLVYSNILYAQNNIADTLYIEYDNINVKEFIDKIDNHHIEVSFSVFSKKDTKVTTYNFKIDNFSKNFDELKFNEIKDILTNNEVRKIKIRSMRELAEMTPLDLHFY